MFRKDHTKRTTDHVRRSAPGRASRGSLKMCSLTREVTTRCCFDRGACGSLALWSERRCVLQPEDCSSNCSVSECALCCECPRVRQLNSTSPMHIWICCSGNKSTTWMDWIKYTKPFGSFTDKYFSVGSWFYCGVRVCAWRNCCVLEYAGCMTSHLYIQQNVTDVDMLWIWSAVRRRRHDFILKLHHMVW